MSNRLLRIISTDPGYDICGYSLLILDRDTRDIQLVTAGAIRTPQGMRYEDRLVQLKKDFDTLVREFKPDAAAIENMFVAKAFENIILVAQARGVILLSLAEAGIIPHAFSPTAVKYALTGNGAAKKPEIMDAVKKHFNLDARIEPDDASDAVAIGLCFAFRVQ